MNAGKKQITEIFSKTRILEIPFFQRSYVWDDVQWERMLEDMENICSTNKPYFLGSVILKKQDDNGNIKTVIDGQQRLTTLFILFKVYFLMTNRNDVFELLFKTLDGKISLQHNHNDIESFTNILDLNELTEIDGKNKIFGAYNFFKKNLCLEKIDYQKILSNVSFVVIDMEKEEENEQQIFDTINSLGVTLTTAELLKNYFFNRDVNLYDKFWKKIFEKDEDVKKYWDREFFTGNQKRTFIDLFFFSFLQIKIQEKELKVTTDDKIGFSKLEQLFESYKKFIKIYLNNNKNSILTEIKEYAIIFQENFDYDIVDKELPKNDSIDRINAIIFGLDNSTLIPYVLYILKNVVNADNKNELFGFIETYIMRRMVVHSNTKNYSRFFTDSLINKEILSKEQFAEFLEKQEDKLNFLPSDEDLKNGFNDSKLINKQSLGILYFIESKSRDDKHSTVLKGIKQYSLEHLMPKKWENNWENLTNQAKITERNRKLLTLGNLAIITQSLNSSIRDADWKTKKEGKGENKKGLNQYASDLVTLNDFLQLEEWNEIAINNRATFLFKKAKKIWKI